MERKAYGPGTAATRHKSAVDLEIEGIQARSAYTDDAKRFLTNGTLLTNRGRLVKDRGVRLPAGEKFIEIPPNTIEQLGFYEKDGKVNIVVAGRVEEEKFVAALINFAVHNYKINVLKGPRDLNARELTVANLRRWAIEFGHGQVPVPEPAETKKTKNQPSV